MPEQYKYNLRGVSADKAEVHEAIKGLDKGLYPMAFCKILPDVVGGDGDYCNIMHADTAGTKTSLAYLYWKETGDLSVWKGIAQDALVMNLDDMACVGCTSDIVVSSTIGRNKNLIPGEIISAIIQGGNEFIEKMRGYGIELHLAGGETADVGDIVRTIDVGYTTFARMRRKDVVVNRIQPGDVIVGLASFGKCIYEEEYNGGMGSNGLTSARHDVLKKAYATNFPESFDNSTPEDVTYCGSKSLTETISIDNQELTVGKLLLSPTRTYLPFLKTVLEKYRSNLHGIIHCTGGGQTKVSKFIQDCTVVKDNLFPIPPLFKLIHDESKTSWKEMYQVFNMGHRLELYLPENLAGKVMDIAESCQIESRIIGKVVHPSDSSVILETPAGTYFY
jgi:phosphoribosylformylglycinamidine cyclo-ligase